MVKPTTNPHNNTLQQAEGTLERALTQGFENISDEWYQERQYRKSTEISVAGVVEDSNKKRRTAPDTGGE